MLRVAYFAPNLHRSGATLWLLDMLRHCDPSAISWVGCWVSGARQPAPDVVAAIRDHIPIHCGDPRHGDLNSSVRYHATPRDAARAAAAAADVVITWELEDTVARLALPQPICLVQHGCWWRPTGVGRLWRQLRVSDTAAGTGPVVRGGVDVARCLPRIQRETTRARWRAGPEHRVLLCLDRHDNGKRTDVWPRLLRRLDHRYKLVVVDQGTHGESRWFSLLRDYIDARRIIVEPYTDRVGDLLAASDLVCSASQREGFARCLVEAWAADVPTLCWSGLRVCDEYDRLAGGTVSYRFAGDPTPLDVDTIFDDPDNQQLRRAARLARQTLSAQAAAARFEAWAHSQFSVRVPVQQRHARARWLYPERAPVIATPADHDWPESAMTADAVTEVPAGVPCDAPVVHATASTADVRSYHVRSRIRDSFVGVMLCPHISTGGIEQWMLQLVRLARRGRWTVVTTSNDPAHSTIRAQFEAAGCVVLSTNGMTAAERAAAISSRIAAVGADVVAFWGVEHVGRFLPPNYAGAVLPVSHGHRRDPWTRHWLQVNSHAATHLCAVSRAAAHAYAPEQIPSVDIVYPGVTCHDRSDQRAGLRARMACGDSLVIAYAGRMPAQKNPLAAAEMVATAADTYLLQIGDAADYPGDIDADIRRLVGVRGLRVPFTTDLDAWLAAADVLVLRSEYESVGLVLLQALQQGCAVVGHPQSVLPELAAEYPDLPIVIVDQGTAPAEALAQVRRILHRRRRADWTGTRFDAAVSVRAFEDYCCTLTAAPAVSAWTIGWRPAQRPVAADAIVVLTGNAEADIPRIQTLQEQDDARVILHLYGTASQLAAAQPYVSNDMPRVVETAGGIGFALAHAAAHAHTDNIVISWPYQRHARDCVTTLAGLLQQHGLELVCDQRGADVVIRRASLIDSLVLSRQGASWHEFLRNVRADGREYGICGPLSAAAQIPDAPWVMPALCAPYDAPSGFDVVIPVRGRLDLLDAAVTGLLQQTYTGRATIHLIDDANPARIAETYFARAAARLAARYAVCRWRTDTNIGQFLAVNGVAPHREHSHMLIHDGDDVSMPTRMELTAQLLAATGARVLVGGAMGFGGAWRRLESGYPRADGYWPYAANPTAAFAWDAFIDLRGYIDFGSVAANRSSLDTEIFHRAIARGCRIHVTNALLTNYRLRPDSCTTDAVSGLHTDARRGVDQWIWSALGAGLLRAIDGSLTACRHALRPVS